MFSSLENQERVCVCVCVCVCVGEREREREREKERETSSVFLTCENKGEGSRALKLARISGFKLSRGPNAFDALASLFEVALLAGLSVHSRPLSTRGPSPPRLTCQLC